ncbi:MAG: cadmium-translocating P-type ATPase [Thermoleophilia bacterium]|nr:cadmium-translocating P-type ATPase [Thermoleophilia bacterium]
MGVTRAASFIRTYPVVVITLMVGAAGLALEAAGRHHAATLLVGGYAVAVAAYECIGMVRTILGGSVGIDILAITAIVATVVVGEYWAALIIVLMLSGGEALEDYAAGRARTELTALLDRAPRVAHRVDGDAVTDIPVGDVAVGDVLLLKTSEVVPVDGVLVSAAASFDESSLTGESLPVERTAGQALLSGAVVGDEAVRMRATAPASESQYQRIVAMVEDAAGSKAPFVRLADRYAVPFTLAAYVLAGAAWWISGDPKRIAEVLVVATPCPLLIGAPVAFIAGMSRAARVGTIVKSGGVLEQLSRVRTAVFDKTGTLTRGAPEVVDVRPEPGHEADAVLRLAASAEERSSHTLAASLVAAARGRGLEIPPARAVRERTGHGVEGQVDGRRVAVGKLAFVAGPSGGRTTPLGPQEMAVYVGIDGALAGAVVLADHVRDEARSTLEALRRMGVGHVAMLTGDGEETARHVARGLGIHDVRAGCLPQDKVAAVAQSPDRPVLMVGDGVNDAPVLAAADVGVAMGARGSTAASESADVVVMLDDVSRVARAVAVAKHTMTVARQSIWLGIAFSVVLMVIAAAGYLPAIAGAAMQELVDLVTILNALRARGRGRHEDRWLAGLQPGGAVPVGSGGAVDDAGGPVGAVDAGASGP